jgi:protein MAK16
MASSDDVIWQLINNGFCSHKSKLEANTFCRHKYNLTGLCSKQACPLANSRYATVLEKDGICYLQMKTAERSHMPNQWWEEVPLSKNYTKALEEIDEQLQYWPKFVIHKVKQRLTKITQYLIRMRRLRKKEDNKRVTVRYHKKVERRLDKREDRALNVARLDQKIKQELLERLKKGTYGDIYNFNQKSFDSILDEEEVPNQELELQDEFIEDLEDQLDEDNLFDVDGDNSDDMDVDNDQDEDMEGNNSDQGDKDHFEANDVDELNKLFSSIPEKDLKTKNDASKRRHIEIEFDKDDEEDYNVDN